jgi:hypothetical protein
MTSFTKGVWTGDSLNSFFGPVALAHVFLDLAPFVSVFVRLVRLRVNLAEGMFGMTDGFYDEIHRFLHGILTSFLLFGPSQKDARGTSANGAVPPCFPASLWIGPNRMVPTCQANRSAIARVARFDRLVCYNAESGKKFKSPFSGER